MPVGRNGVIPRTGMRFETEISESGLTAVASGIGVGESALGWMLWWLSGGLGNLSPGWVWRFIMVGMGELNLRPIFLVMAWFFHFTATGFI